MVGFCDGDAQLAFLVALYSESKDTLSEILLLLDSVFVSLLLEKFELEVSEFFFRHEGSPCLGGSCLRSGLGIDLIAFRVKERLVLRSGLGSDLCCAPGWGETFVWFSLLGKVLFALRVRERLESSSG